MHRLYYSERQAEILRQHNEKIALLSGIAPARKSYVQADGKYRPYTEWVGHSSDYLKRFPDGVLVYEGEESPRVKIEGEW